MSLNLNPEKALLFRIVHRANIPWILDHRGLDCRNCPEQDPNYINIGNAELIDKRSNRQVPVSPGGTLSDYVPFCFTPFSMMMFKIKTGHRGITRRDNADIVIFVSSIHRLHELKVSLLITNQHAYPPDTEFYDSLEGLRRSIGLFCAAATSKRMMPTRESRCAIRRRHWCIDACLSTRCLGLDATPMG